VAEGEISHSRHERSLSWPQAVGPGTIGGACQRVCPGIATTQLNESVLATGIGANLLFKTGGPRLSIFGAGGVALDWVSGELNVSRTCRQALPGRMRGRSSDREPAVEPQYLAAAACDGFAGPSSC
jgi:hypothetical protein